MFLVDLNITSNTHTVFIFKIALAAISSIRIVLLGCIVLFIKVL